MKWVTRFVSISKSSSHSRDGEHHGGFRVPYTFSTLGWVTKRKVEQKFPKNELVIHTNNIYIKCVHTWC
jgi:hypothetical protein